MAKIEIDIPISLEEFKELAAKEPSAAARSLDRELRHFDQHLMRNKMDPMTRFERQMVREYLGYKLVNS
jgi:hypothetical protein